LLDLKIQPQFPKNEPDKKELAAISLQFTAGLLDTAN
jgi:hypothetical protein